MNIEHNETALARALDELSTLPSFAIVKAWIDERREQAIANLSVPGISTDDLRFHSGYLNMTEEIREKILAHSREFNSYQTTETPRLGSASGKKGGVA